MKAVDIALFFLSKDNGTLFNNNLVERDNRTFYEGNARLNKYLHIAQNLYIAKTGKKLFEDTLYAYDNGAVVPAVQESYSVLQKQSLKNDIPEDTKSFLEDVYLVLGNASLDELIEISHEDVEWEDKHIYYKKDDQRMDSMKHIDLYKEQYADMLKVMERMHI